MKRFLTVLLGMTLVMAPLFSENSNRYIFRMLDTSSGLPDNNVRNMVMLPNGLMCIQTTSILNLYDGTSCRSYKYNATEIPYAEYGGLNYTYYDNQENVLWCTRRDRIWIFNLNTRMFEYNIQPRLEQLGVKNKDVQSIHVDNDGKFWIFTSDNAVHICDRRTGLKHNLSMPEGMTFPITLKQHHDKVWVMSMNGKIAEYDTSIEEFRMVKTIPLSNPINSSSRMEMDITDDGEIWMMFDKDLIKYDSSNECFHNISSIPPDSKDLYTTIALDNQNNLWLGTARSGISIITDDTTTTLPYLELTNGKKIYHHSDVSKIFIDDKDGVWIATQAEGLLYWHKDIIRFKTIDNSTIVRGNLNDESVKCMIEGDNGNIYIGTIQGLFLYNPDTKEVSLAHKALKDELCIGLYKDSKNRIWVGTFYNGAYCIDGDKISHYKYLEVSVDFSYHNASTNFNCVRSFYEDSSGGFWISVYGGVGRFNPDTGEITMLHEEHKDLSRFMIVRDICSQADQSKLLMAGDNGRFIYDTNTDSIISDLNSESSHTQTNQAIKDNRDLLWIATVEGIEVHDFKNNEKYKLDSRIGLPAGNIMSIALDDVGNIWAASFNYISRIKPVIDSNGKYTFAIASYGAEDGVNSGAFFQKSVVKHSNGHIYFGGAHGICDVNPQDLYQAKSDLLPLITSIDIAGKTVETWGKKLILKHDQSFLTFEFSNLNYANPSHTTYLYKLKNFDKDWRRAISKGAWNAQYTYLEPGNYTFQLKAANNDTDWSDITEIDITIRPPLHKSVAAYIFYAMLLIGIAAAFTFWQWKQAKRKIQENKEREKQRQRENLDQMKFKFFTNISHELRTPLSLIILPLESIIKEMKDSPLMPKLQTMHHNATQLMSLVNHLLDFRKLEMSGERLHLNSGNISEFIGGIVHSFKDAAQKNNLTLTFEDWIEKPMMVFDNSQMQKIINNLLSNALKFTPEGGSINVRLTQTGNKTMVLEVEDTGIGIPMKDIDKIFDRFYRSGNTELRTGSGIGLSLVKQYIEMHSGSIDVKSELGKGTLFTVSIPMDLKATDEAENTITTVDEHINTDINETGETSESRRHIMVVDDNLDFREYLIGELAELYEVSSASDGKQCLEKLKTANPDVIICDVMMPNMDGFEVVKAIKDNIETSHIPIILLSARTSEDIRLEGYETGADAYLTKPFKFDILLARVRNLIEERNRRIASFSKNEEISPSEVTITTIDQKLLTRIMGCIEKNMDNADYSVEELSSDVGMHRMNLYRKIQSIAGMTPSEFIRTMRLKRAAQLLKSDPNLTVSEISDMVGFNTQKYFTKYFKEMFGVTPSQYR